MNDLLFFDKWINIIQEQNNWSDCSQWTEVQYQQLRDEISSKSKTTLEIETLKQIVESVSKKKNHYVSITKKNDLAKHIGFQSWFEFKHSIISSGARQPYPKWVILAISVALMLGLVLATVLNAE